MLVHLCVSDIAVSFGCNLILDLFYEHQAFFMFFCGNIYYNIKSELKDNLKYEVYVAQLIIIIIVVAGFPS